MTNIKKLGTKGNEQPYMSKDLMRSIYNCPYCKQELLMFGCDNPKCENYYIKNLKHDKEALNNVSYSN